MTYVITQACCNDASCVPVCPVNCIHPAPGEPGYMTTEMLYIDPEACIECSACVQVCPVDAIKPEEELTVLDIRFLEINKTFYERHPIAEFEAAAPARRPGPPEPAPDLNGLRVAVVGSGPAGSYAAAALLEHKGVHVDVYERLLTPYGLIRFGVAPDHAGTKAVSQSFPYTAKRPGLALHLGVEVGTHISHDELLQHHHAVVYAVGANSDRKLCIPGEDLPGSVAATDFVAWYNGHPDFADSRLDLTSERAVIIGNGNVALDVARILVSDPERLANTDIAAHALEALRTSKVREVVVVGRRGPVQAAYSTSELMALTQLADVDVVAYPDEVELDPVTRAIVEAPDAEPVSRLKAQLAAEIAAHEPTPGHKRIVLRFAASPSRVTGEGRVESVALVHNELALDGGHIVARPTGTTEHLKTGLFFRSVGYRGTPTPGVPFDDARGVIPNHLGRVLNSVSQPLTGTYVTGWIKRGPTGVIGTNKQCATDTVKALIEDFVAGRLTEPTGDTESLAQLLSDRSPDHAELAGWSRIDAAERAAGTAAGRPRLKLVTRSELLAASQGD
jgi:ferredoxin--NADP+ reductase